MASLAYVGVNDKQIDRRNKRHRHMALSHNGNELYGNGA